MSFIFEGNLVKNEASYNVRRLTIADLEAIEQLQSTVYHHLQDKSRLQRLTRQEFEFIINGNGLLIGAISNGQLIAIRALLIPEIDEHHLGHYIGLKQSELQHVLYQEISFVHPAFQGNGLQQQLAECIMDEFQKQDHHFTYVCATVAPDNIASLKDKFKQNMVIQYVGPMYGNKLRYVFVKPIHQLTSRTKKSIQSKLVPLQDLDSQKELLASSAWSGVQLLYEQDMYWILFEKYEYSS